MKNLILHPGFTKWSSRVISACLGLLLGLIASASAFSNGEKASAVLGESDFTSYMNAYVPGPTSINQASGFAYDSALHRLFVCSKGHNQVMVYDISGGITNNMNASYVLGQPDFTTTWSGTPDSLNTPSALAYDSTRKYLFVADRFNNRVLVYDLSGTITNGMAPAHVLGQTDINGTMGSTSQNGLDGPFSLTYDSTHQWLFVGEDNNRRIVVYDLSGSITDGMNASYVLGQTNFTSNTAYWPPTDKSMFPNGLTYDPFTKKLFVSDANYNRVLVFNLASGLSNNMSASNVLGQADFVSYTSYPVAPNSLLSPGAMSVDSINQRLFVTDPSRHRMIIFDLSRGITNNMNASWVLGQPDLVSTNGTMPSQTTFQYASGVLYDQSTGLLYLADVNAGRALVFGELEPGCGTAMICGTITAAENGTINLTGVPVELRDGKGKLVTTKKTNSSGAFTFGPAEGVTMGQDYTVSPVVKRMQSINYTQISTGKLQPWGATANFQIRNWPAIFQATSTAGSLVLISTSPYTGASSANPPTLTANSVNQGYYSALVGSNNIALAQVPGSGTYYMTCWVVNANGNSVSIARTPSTGSSGPFAASPNQTVPVTCQ